MDQQFNSGCLRIVLVGDVGYVETQDGVRLLSWVGGTYELPARPNLMRDAQVALRMELSSLETRDLPEDNEPGSPSDTWVRLHDVGALLKRVLK